VATPSAPTLPEIKRLLHALREPLSTFAINVDLLEGTQLTAEGQSYLKAMHTDMKKARAALDEIAFIVENGHAPSAPRRSSR
jgi:hypothetical protein